MILFLLFECFLFEVFISISISIDLHSANSFCYAIQVNSRYKKKKKHYSLRTIGCCFCCCDLPCCQNPDSLYDPCGSQYSALQYLLRKQKPLILYANFLGAFGRGILEIFLINNHWFCFLSSILYCR
jgi:hypothetical protein